MLLKDIVDNWHIKLLQGSLDIDIKDISNNSKEIKEDNMFIALRGYTVDGHDYVEDAINNGATCIIIDKDLKVSVKKEITVIKVEDTLDAMAKFSAEFYDNPSHKIKLIGVTGTNGKTSITYMIRDILREAGYKTGIIGTLGTLIEDKKIINKNTTPESLTINKHLSLMVKENIEYCIMEVSSHSLELKRVEYMDFKIGVFSNLSEEHLDYHLTMENYYESKLKLFKRTKLFNIINYDDNYGKKIYGEKLNNASYLTYGLNNKANIFASDIVYNMEGSKFTLNTKDKVEEIKLNLLGEFNVYNALAAITCCLSLNIPLDFVKIGIETTRNIKGRFEIVPLNKDYTVIIDFAHTPDGLEKVLTTIDQFADGRKVVIFGAGGNRDRKKRPIMGETVARHADLCIVTSDNPRFEDPDKIIQDVIVGVEKVKGNYIAITDRKEAIEYAIKNAKAKDLILLAGKGHETYIIKKDKVLPFDEKEIVIDIVNNL